MSDQNDLLQNAIRGRVYFGSAADREMGRVANEMADRRGRVQNAGHVVVDGTVNGTVAQAPPTFGYTDIGYVSGDVFAAPPGADAGEPFFSAERWQQVKETPIKFTYVSGNVDAMFARCRPVDEYTIRDTIRDAIRDANA